MQDSNFQRSVVLMCEHQDNQGSFGLIINKPSMVMVSEVADSLYADNQLFVGGPVEQNTLHYIHQFENVPNAIPLKDGLYWGGDYEVMKEMASRGMVNEGNTRFFMGYSGWGRMQLSNEMKKESWFVSDVNLRLIFDIEPHALWSEVLKSMGGRYRIFANYPIDARMN
ncbi:MAG: YqgE/AlgH family protein [Flammeovirgaceae bacterium]